MRGIPRPSPAMIVALVALIVAVGGTAAALPGKFSVGRGDLKQSSIGARALGKMMMGRSLVLKAEDPVAGDGTFTEATGIILCPSKAPTAIDPFVSRMGPKAFLVERTTVSNRFDGPKGYRFTVSSDEGPNVGYTMKVNCLFRR